MRIFLFIAGLVAAAFLAYRYVPNIAQTIENQVTEDVTAALIPNDLPADVQIKVDGRDVVLSGMVLRPSDKKNFVDLSQNVKGVRTVQDDIVFAEALNSDAEIIEEVNITDEPLTEAVAVSAEPVVNEDVALVEIEETVTPETAPAIAEQPVIEEAAVDGAVIDQDMSEAVTAPDMDALQEAEEATQEEVIVMDESGKKASQECQSTIAALVSGKRVNFTTGQSKIKRESLPLLNDIAQEMRGCSDIALHIHGHTDNVGDVKLNRQLSHKRARSVGLYLLRQGVTQRIKIFGNGADQPIADNETEAGRTANRRIEFKVKDAQASVANDNERTNRSVFTTRSLRDAAIIER